MSYLVRESKKVITLFSEADTILLAKSIAPLLKHGDVLLLYGDLGTGKTFFTKHLCHFLGIEETVSSPTFVLLNQYCSGEVVVNHYDLYRIKTADEALDLGINDFLHNSITIIEWPDVVAEYVPYFTFKLNFLYGPPRSVTVERGLR